MPDTPFGSGSIFDEYRSQLSGWLRANMEQVYSLSRQNIELYNDKGKRIVVGWEVKPHGSDLSFRILLDSSFPFSHIKIAYIGECRHLQWPHVEENGFLCLPISGWRPIEDLVSSIRQRISYAQELLEDCHSEEYVKNESSREFLSYWARSAPSRADILSLIDPSNEESRLVSVAKAGAGWLAGENTEAIQEWMHGHNRGEAVPTHYFQAVFGCIETPPSLPLPNTAKQFFKQLIGESPQIKGLFEQLSPFEETFILLAVKSGGGKNLLGARLSRIPENGFRKPPKGSRKKLLSASRARRAWDSFTQLTLVRADRADGAWVHGRGLDPHHRTLADARLVVLGCGSLGSQVASRLAQAGIGQMLLVDPENLTPSNVGRHALGMDSVRRNKAGELAMTLSAKYPHSSFKGIKTTFQVAIHDNSDIFKDADLIISCIAEADQDYAWDSWYRAEGISAPVIYGWLGTQGTTGHALALNSNGPALSCFFTPDGFLRNPDTDFDGDPQMKVEPGCGTEFQPFGPLSAGQAELLVTRLSIDVLTNKVSVPHHNVYACSTNDLEALGGRWTANHKEKRPSGYEGPFEYSPQVSKCGGCYQCTDQ